MQHLSIEVPDVIWESHQRDPIALKTDIRQGFIIWEYLNGRIGLRECSEILCMSYRNFLELLWSKGIPIDALDDNEIHAQANALCRRLDSEQA